MTSLQKTAEQLRRHYSTLIIGDVHPTDHPVEKGGAREHGWRKLFRRFLPNRYGVKSGFIIDSFGALSEQIDCIVYRKDIGIELYSVGHHTVIPIEVVFGVFEIKPSMAPKELRYSEQKGSTVTALRLTNKRVRSQSTGEFTDKLCTVEAKGSVVVGLLADKIKRKTNKWRIPTFLELMKQDKTHTSVFMTVEDGCANTLSTGYPTQSYRLFNGDQALFHQLIELAESFAVLEKSRCFEYCCLKEYKSSLDSPEEINIE